MSEEIREKYKLRGEWWIDDSNHLVFADGDVSDSDHNTIALHHAQSNVGDAIGLDDDAVESEGFIEAMVEHLDEEVPGWNQSGDRGQNMCRAISRLCEQDNREVSSLEISVACEVFEDARTLAVQEWKWVSLRKNHVLLWEADKHRLEQVNRAIGEAFYEEGIDLTKEMENDVDLEITVASTGKNIYTTLAGIRDFDTILHGEIPSLDRGKIAMNQLTSIDKGNLHPAYRRKLGD